MTSVDIGLFDFDRHNAIYYFVMNADEHIYLRYGGRDASSPHAYLNLSSLEIALELGLEQHELYKQGKLERQTRPAPLFPRDIPLLKREVIDRRRCVECHLIGDYQTQQLEVDGQLNKIRDLYVSPDIRTAGIFLDKSRGLVVKSVAGAVEAAGMKPGDLITAINESPVLTFGDLQYYYDKVPRNAKQVRIEVHRSNERKLLVVDLPEEWWRTDLNFRYYSTEPLLFFSTDPLTNEEKKAHGLPVGGFASKVSNVDPQSKTFSLNELQLGDIIYSVNGVEMDKRTQHLETHITLSQTAGESFPVKLLRDGKELEMRIRSIRQGFRQQQNVM
jgi:hypothetical protein